jgi:hypothetical protein
VSATTADAYGYAADVTTKDKAQNRLLFHIIAGMMKKEMKIDQLIDENGYSWLHIGGAKQKQTIYSSITDRPECYEIRSQQLHLN